MDVYTAVQSVTDAERFIEFLDALRSDWETAVTRTVASSNEDYTSDAWENTTIGDFLEASVAGARDHKVGQAGGKLVHHSAWRQAAEVILLGKVYE
ncbi:DUF7660 family protein [Halovulum sp. GXIMD14793]